MNRAGITPETAIALAEAFGQEAKTWMNLQVSYELALAAKKDRDTARRAKIYGKMPIRDAKRRHWIPDVSQTEDLEKAVLDFLSIPTLDDVPQYSVAARKSTEYGIENPAQCAWYARVRQLAEGAPASSYDPANFESGVSELLKLAAYPEDVRRVPRVLGDMGVRLVLVEKLPKSKIDGVAMWLDGSSPVVGMSIRYDRIDNFWFTLLHELIHVKYKEVSPIDVDIMKVSDDLPEMEKRANAEAADYLIPSEKLDSFIVRTEGLYSQTKVSQFAQARRVHPGIVIGQLQFRDKNYSRLRGLLAKVRDHIIGQAITDGWGHFPNIED
jgi:HTH-type transcriptional regulator/antitoxin HigA